MAKKEVKSKTQPKKKNVKNKDLLSLKKTKNLNKVLNEALKESENKNLRLMAEFDNLKKRTQRSIIDSYNRNLENVILSFLPIIDDFDRMIDNENKAKESLNRFIGNNPNDGDAHYLLGTIYENILDEDNAIKSYDKAIELSSTNFNSYKNLGLIFYTILHLKFHHI